MQQHNCCHALACLAAGHHGLSRTIFSASPHDDLFGWACVVTTSNCNLDNAAHTVFFLAATAGMVSVMSVSPEWSACCILEWSIPLGVGRETALNIFCV